jgi:hypothetical protein
MIFRSTITADTPEGWLAKESITLLDPSGQANVIASSEPLNPTTDTGEYATVQGDLLRTEFPGYKELSFQPTELFGGRSGFVRKFEWTPPDGDPVTQYQLYYAENGRGYTATATAASRSLPRFETTMLEVLKSLDISPSLAGVS